MPHTGPDFGNYYPRVTTAPLGDVGELAVRLGSINSYDRRGLVVNMDDFESPVLKAYTLTDAEGSAVYLDITNTRSGAQSVCLALASALGAYASIQKWTPILALSKVGLEFSYCLEIANFYIDNILNYYDGTSAWTGTARLNTATGKLYIQKSDGTYLEIAETDYQQVGANMFHTLKLVVDFTTNKYKRVIYNFSEYDVSDEALVETVVAAPKRLEPVAKVLTIAATGGLSWIDDYILTQDEP